jgi:hypothetical protein
MRATRKDRCARNTIQPGRGRECDQADGENETSYLHCPPKWNLRFLQPGKPLRQSARARTKEAYAGRAASQPKYGHRGKKSHDTDEESPRWTEKLTVQAERHEQQKDDQHG